MPKFRFVALGALLATSVLCGAGLLILPHVDLASFAEKKLHKITGRQVHVGAVHVTLGRWVLISVDDVSIANIPQGSRPEMMTLKHVDAEARLVSLLRGAIVLRNVKIANFFGLFERTSDHVPNWRFGTGKPEKTEKQPNQPDPPSWLPDMKQLSVSGSEVIYRSANGHSYRIGLDKVSISTDHPNAAVNIAVDGSYNNVPVSIGGMMGALSELRSGKSPYPVDLKATSGDLTISLKGTTRDLFNFDGIDGNLSILTPTSAPIMAIAGMAASSFSLKLSLDAHFTHAGNLWAVAQTKGVLGDNPINSANIKFNEGDSGQPDQINGDVDFAKLDINSLLPASKTEPDPHKHTDLPLMAPERPDPLLDIRLSSEKVRYNSLIFSKVLIGFTQKPGLIDLSNLQLEWEEASVHATGKITNQKNSADLQTDVDVTGANIDKFRRQVGLAPVPVDGSLALRVHATATGVRTLNEASRTANIDAAVGMNSGKVSRQLVDLASVNLRWLFHRNSDTTHVQCMLGALSMRNGEGTVVPLRLYTDAGAIVGEAMFNLNKRWFELAFQSSETGFWALDIPIRVSGPFNNPSLGLAGWSARGRALLKQAQTANALPPGLKNFTTGRACLNNFGKH